MTAHAYWRAKMVTYPTTYVNITEINFTDANGNMFSNSGATALDSAHFSSYVPANAIDGDVTTTWSGDPGTSPFYLGIHYTSAVEAFGIQLSNFTGGPSAPTVIDVQYSDDGTNWFDRVTGLALGSYDSANAFWPGDTILKFFDAPTPDYGAHAYWRCLTKSHRGINVSGANFYGNTLELDFFDSASTQLSTGGTALENAHFGAFPPSGAFTHSGTPWSGDFRGSHGCPEGQTAWIGYQMGSAVVVDHVRIKAYDSSQFLGFYLQYSDDGTTWYTRDEFTDFTAFTANEVRTYTVSAVLPSGTIDFEFSGVSLDLTGTSNGVPPSGTIDFEFVTVELALAGTVARAGEADLEFAGITLDLTGGHGPSGQIDLEFGGVSLDITGSDIHVKGSITLAFAVVDFSLAGNVPTTAGTGLRQFWTFGN